MSESLAYSSSNLIWIDLEMTGLDTDHDHIIEIATVVTDCHLKSCVEGPVIAIHQSDEVLDAMDEWNTKQHGGSGLTERVRQSQITAVEAAERTLKFLELYVPAKTSPMCGNSICQDRRFMHREMSELEQYFHYRHLDVSTLKILAQHWKPDILAAMSKTSQHLALADIHDSINELCYYREHLLNINEI